MRSVAFAAPLADFGVRGRHALPVNRFAPSQKMRWSAFAGLSGVAFGAVLTAIPLASNIATFGLFGTLSMAAIECAVIAGAFAALASALADQSKMNISPQNETSTLRKEIHQ